MLLMVANPRTSCHLVDFVNDLKKTGLYVVGHIHIGTMDDSADTPDPAQLEYPKWLELIDYLKVRHSQIVTIWREADLQTLGLIYHINYNYRKCF